MNIAEVTSHTVLRRMFMKKFGEKGKRTKLFAEKRFSEVHKYFQKFETVSDHRSKRISPVKGHLKEVVKSQIDLNPGSSIRKIASVLNSTYYSMRTTMKKDLHPKPYKYYRCQGK